MTTCRTHLDMLRYLRGRDVAVQDNMGGSSIDRLTNQAGGMDGEIPGVNGGAETHTLVKTQMHHTTTQVSSSCGKTLTRRVAAPRRRYSALVTPEVEVAHQRHR